MTVMRTARPRTGSFRGLGHRIQLPSRAAEPIVLASTTSLQDSGLLAQILPFFTAQTGIAVRVVAQGTGQALATAARGDADLVLVHDPDAEAAFMAAGHGQTSDRDRLERLCFGRSRWGPRPGRRSANRDRGIPGHRQLRRCRSSHAETAAAPMRLRSESGVRQG